MVQRHNHMWPSGNILEQPGGAKQGSLMCCLVQWVADYEELASMDRFYKVWCVSVSLWGQSTGFRLWRQLKVVSPVIQPRGCPCPTDLWLSGWTKHWIAVGKQLLRKWNAANKQWCHVDEQNNGSFGWGEPLPSLHICFCPSKQCSVRCLLMLVSHQHLGFIMHGVSVDRGWGTQHYLKACLRVALTFPRGKGKWMYSGRTLDLGVALFPCPWWSQPLKIKASISIISIHYFVT